MKKESDKVSMTYVLVCIVVCFAVGMLFSGIVVLIQSVLPPQGSIVVSQHVVYVGQGLFSTVRHVL